MYKDRLIFKVFFFIIAINLSIIYTIFAQDSSKEEEALFVARKAQEDGFYEVALNLYERFLRNYPSTKRKSEVNLYIGQCYFFQKKYLEALKKFEELLIHPDAQDIKDAVLYWMAEVRFRNNDFNQASSLYRQIIERFPKSSYIVSSYYSLGWCLYENKNYSEALDYFKTVLEKYPQDSLAQQAKLKIMDCLYALKDFKGLKEFIEAYLKGSPDKPEQINYIRFYQAEADYYLGNFETAKDIYSQLIKGSKDERIITLARLGLGWCFIKLGNYKEAEVLFKELENKNLDKKDYEICLLGMAHIFSQTKRFDDALKIYSELMGIVSPQNQVEVYLGKANALYNLSRYAEAIGVYQEAFKNLDFNNIDLEIQDKLHYNLGWAYLKEARFKEAIAEFQKVASASSDKMIRIASLCLAADTYQDAGQYEKAIHSYEEILKEYPDNLYSDYIQYQLGICFLKMSNYDSAVLAFKALLKNFPRSKLLDEANYALALTYFQKEDFSSAIEILKDFARDFKDSPLVAEATYLYASSLYNTERFNEAMEVFKSMVKNYSENKELIQKAEYEIADCLYRLGKEEEAINQFNSLRAKYPDANVSAEAMWWLGSYYWRLDKPDLAKRYFETIIQNFPQSNILSDVYYALGFIYTEEENYPRAIEYFYKVKEMAEPDLAGQAAIAIGDVLTRQNRLREALDIYRQIIQDYPNLSSIVYPKIAEVNRLLGNLEEAVVFYRKAQAGSSFKQAGSFQFKIAECLQEKGLIEQAIEEYLKVNYLYPQDKSLVAKALIRVAQIYEGKNDLQSARDLYQKIIQMDAQEAKYAKERLESIDLSH